ncbi:hypothetical protein Adt_28732 [Abeliophyllum distichum]|uniref:Uncharacterized protein n=1 Tax=Abeliophyllum distichum TaxID=126358 RepID=A0ABD1S1M4_9LAMI
MKDLLSSEDTDFGLEQTTPIPKHTENYNAKEIDPSRVAFQRNFQKRALDIPDDGGPKRLKFTFPSTRNVPFSERVEKIPGTILVSKDNNSGDQASRRLEATLVPEDSSSEDQLYFSLFYFFYLMYQPLTSDYPFFGTPSKAVDTTEKVSSY